MATPRRAGRQKTQLPPCYYEGYLEKRSFKDKVPRRLWTCLCGNTLFFFNNTKEADYVEKLDLSGVISVSDDSSHDRNLEAARFNLHMKDGDMKVTAPSLEARELWKGFILSVVKLEVPSSLNLLPGPIHMMRETVEKEKERQQSFPVSAPTPSDYVPLVPDMPACFQQVSRTEAELLLERNPKCGNLLLRPGRDGSSFAITTRQELNGSVFRHYRVTRRPEGGFAIEVENRIPCATLHDVVTHLIERTGGTLQPFIMEKPYEESITFVQANEESGEKTLMSTSARPISTVPKPPPKPVPRERKHTPEPPSYPEENIYLNVSQDEEDESTPVPPPVAPRLPAPRKPAAQLSSTTDDCLDQTATRPLRPVPFPRSASDASEIKHRPAAALATPESLASGLSEELKLKLEKRRVVYDS
ncbi:signal-transducing adaptor protein 2b [Chanos chanos]|uniref:Signal-transducing adaptor protein 2b n=1 Tax=Chanos chanos TaxID=29144 RepID=A0A6J2W8E6_CHACN|nr:signal-transducing adaptor protein 1-like [Chanos chanos]